MREDGKPGANVRLRDRRQNLSFVGGHFHRRTDLPERSPPLPRQVAYELVGELISGLTYDFRRVGCLEGSARDDDVHIRSARRDVFQKLDLLVGACSAAAVGVDNTRQSVASRLPHLVDHQVDGRFGRRRSSAALP
jgi:hypothetical protein